MVFERSLDDMGAGDSSPWGTMGTLRKVERNNLQDCAKHERLFANAY